MHNRRADCFGFPPDDLGVLTLVAGSRYRSWMELTETQYAPIASCLPRQRGNVSMPNLQVLNAILYVAEQGCKWRGLPRRFGNWHTIYTRMNRWSKNGVLDRVFEHLQRAQLIRIKLEAVSLDSTLVKVHPDGTGARKKTASRRAQAVSAPVVSAVASPAALRRCSSVLQMAACWPAAASGTRLFPSTRVSRSGCSCRNSATGRSAFFWHCRPVAAAPSTEKRSALRSRRLRLRRGSTSKTARGACRLHCPSCRRQNAQPLARHRFVGRVGHRYLLAHAAQNRRICSIQMIHGL